MNNGLRKLTWPGRNWLMALLLLFATFVAYQPLWHIGYIIGKGVDNEGIDRDLSSWQGLQHIWTEQGRQPTKDQYPGPPKAYYPLAYTTYWLEFHLWGPKPLGYYLDNVLLHGLNAVVLWLILRRLKVPGAWLGAALWALHPVHVESVAWLAERKNTLSGLFYVCAILAALKYWLPELWDEPPLQIERTAGGEERHQNIATALPKAQRGPLRFYWMALALYILALFSKTTAIPLPAVILLLVWWKRGRILWPDVRPLLVFPVVGIAMGLETMRVEHNLNTLPNFRVNFALPLADRFIIAGRDVWFYLGKLLWPHPLVINYIRWNIDASSVIAWIPLLAVLALLWLFWFKRHSWGRPALVAFLYFLLLLFPVLGFFNAIFFRRSFVADHYQYLACIGPLTLAAAGIVMSLGRLGKTGYTLKPLLGTALLSVLAILTRNQSNMYVDPETLYKATLAVNPDAWVVRNYLAEVLREKGQTAAVIEQLRMAMQTHPDPTTSYDLASMLLNEGKTDDAVVYFRTALQIQPNFAMAYDGLGNACMLRGQMDEAIQNFQKALQIQPDMAPTCFNLGNAYIRKGQLDPAIEYWQKAVNIQPTFAAAQNNLADALISKGQAAQAIPHLKAALTAQPNMVGAQVNLAWVMAACPLPELRDGPDALALAEEATELTNGRNPMVLRSLAAAYAENGNFTNAVAAAKLAIKIANIQSNAGFASSLQPQLKAYQSGQPFRDAKLIANQ